MGTSTPTDNAEWSRLITRIFNSLPEINTSRYPTPKDSLAAISKIIDHTQLALNATEAQIDTLCAEAIKYNFATVCVRPNFVSRTVQQLKDTGVGVTCVIGFHEGTYGTAANVSETQAALRDGATELDMVLNYQLLKRLDYAAVYENILAVRKASKPTPNTDHGSSNNIVLKVILETSQLTRAQIVSGCVVSCSAGADFVKTSTGFNGPGATVEDVATMRAVCEAMGNRVKVKASGGVRTAEDCIRMIRAGAERIGTSSGVKIVSELGGKEVGAAEGKGEY
ncbi:deoxyribose-phosphate aldolase [Paracoccidioides brasiliensis Pb18]|uniref:deoxyribose-phosphate aldolase n=1 Tax=Paracoccidioides brasiliensis (strain Pb18) TaxID=502780 RepID=C1GFL8_PARBD|nr:deoxyribose-phosphate aldolase [Paracoccidioides brasiliensis Pb18]EEH49975.1 deoxyribose-phosphate aldolase [Paracoccidioides brasiliensis Pb18]ODH47726.1 deoxyribose-phosphate aldolase [Paracoccidioides brasiliensis]